MKRSWQRQANSGHEERGVNNFAFSFMPFQRSAEAVDTPSMCAVSANVKIEREQFKLLLLGPNTKLPEPNYIPDGNSILIHFIRSNRKLDIFGETFEVPKSLVASCVKAVSVTEIHQLEVYLGDELVATFEYRLTTQN